ncbi:unnamed protein product [Enterobius vermicularis]|uniref:RRM domain-containing protein n=1 Tax=Enterobius vermicularis TaxID=51028 RepID=A0A0N4UVT0_ENTVE|nr:unnamed protein product [Enterobius vermicularis]
MSSTDAEVASTEPSAPAVLSKPAPEEQPVIKPSGDDAPTTNGESTEAVNEKKDTDAPLQVSMEEEPKEDFDATPVKGKSQEEESSKDGNDIKDDKDEPDQGSLNASAGKIENETPEQATKVEDEKEEPVVEKTEEPTKEVERGGWKLLADEKKKDEEMPPEAPETEPEPEKMEVDEKVESEEPLKAEEKKPPEEEHPPPPEKSETEKHETEEKPAEKPSEPEQKTEVMEEKPAEAPQEGVSPEKPVDKEEEEERMQVDEGANPVEENVESAKPEVSAEPEPKTPEEKSAEADNKDDSFATESLFQLPLKRVLPKWMVQDANAPPSPNKEEPGEKPEQVEKVEESKSPNVPSRGRGRGRGRSGRGAARTPPAKPQPEVNAESLSSGRPRRSTRSTVDYANPDVATVVAEQEDLENEVLITRGRGRNRGRGAHRAGKRSADDDDDGEDSGSEYGGPSRKKKARGSASYSGNRSRGRGRGRGGRTPRSSRGKKKEKEENESDVEEEEMDLGDDDAASDGSAEETYKPTASKRRSDTGQSAKASPKKRGRASSLSFYSCPDHLWILEDTLLITVVRNWVIFTNSAVACATVGLDVLMRWALSILLTEFSSKYGWVGFAELMINGSVIQVYFYDLVRFSQFILERMPT